MRRHRYSFLLFILLAVLLSSGCGKQTMPVPPQNVVPEPVSDLAYSLDENGLSLSWSFPRKMMNGDDLDRVESFQVFRAMVPVDEYCPGCPVPFELHATVAGGEVEDAGANFAPRYHESTLRPQYRYFYKVRPSQGRWFVGQDSAALSFAWDSPPSAPLDLIIEAGDRTITLSWQPPEALVDGRLLGGEILYQPYRSDDGLGFVPLAEPQADTTFTDNAVVNDRLYFYKVRALHRYEDTLLIGAAGKEASGVPKDIVPPGPPLNLVAIATGVGVRLSWDGGADEDLAGFRVYRRRADESSRQMIGEVMAPVTVFTDTANLSAEAATWYYSVTAFDRAMLPNESVFSGEAVVNVE